LASARPPSYRTTARTRLPCRGWQKALAEHDDAVLAAYLDGQAVTPGGWLRRKLAAQVKDALVHPVFFGSASTGAGVDVLLRGLAGLLPAAGGDASGPVSGRVFKVERGAAGDKVAYARMFSGTIAIRDRVRFGDGDGDGKVSDGKVTAISVFADGTAKRRDSVSAGQIARLSGLGGDPGRRRDRDGTRQRGRSPLRAADA